MAAAFECVFARAQNLSNNRLYDLKRSGDIDDFILPYLGQRDELLTHAPTDIVTRESTAGYPTNFSAMKSNWVIALSLRGEQLVHALLKQHWSASNVSPN
jgi:NTE family protein